MPLIYWAGACIIAIGLYILIAHDNLVRKLLGLNVLQVGVFVLYIAFGFLQGGKAPILDAVAQYHVAALPHVLILTAIVVNISTTTLGLALVLRIHLACGSIEEREVTARLGCP